MLIYYFVMQSTVTNYIYGRLSSINNKKQHKLFLIKNKNHENIKQ